MRWCFFDDVATGHHPGYVAGITEAAQGLGLDPIVGSAIRPDGLPVASWLSTVSRPSRSVFNNRRQLARVAALAHRSGAQAFVDLFLDKNAWAVSQSLEAIPTRLHVVHHAVQYDVARRQGMAAVRTRILQRRVRHLAHRGARIVAHTRRAAEIMATAVPAESLVTIGYPVRLVEPNEDRPSGRVNLLFVGAGRQEKGLDLLINAMPSHDEAHLTVMGRQPDGFRQGFEGSTAAIQWIDQYVSDESLIAAYRAASAVVLPYRSEFGDHGGPSSVLLEALSYGLPIVTTRALQDQLPSGYKGAIVVESDSSDSLAEGLRQLTTNLERLTAASRQDGPNFVAANHTFESYVKGLIAHGRPTPGR